MEKIFRLTAKRYPFFDFAAAVGRRLKLGTKLSKAAPPVEHPDESEARWFGEGGNTQTRTVRSVLP